VSHRRPASAALLAAIVLASGCTGRARDGEVTIKFWGFGREGEAVRALIPEFERRHPGIRVQAQMVPWTAAHEKLLTAYVGGSLPDVAQIGNTWIPEFVALGALEPLDARVAASPGVLPRGFFEGIWATGYVGDALFGIPWYVDTRLLFYRGDLLQAAGYPDPPRTWKEWRSAMEAIKARHPDRYAVLLPIDEWAQVVILGVQKGSPLLREDGRYGAFRGPEFREAFSFYVDLFRDGLAPVASAGQIANVYQQFAEGYFAMYITGPWNLGEFHRRLPPEIVPVWRTAPFPAPGPYADRPGASLAGGSALSVFASSRRKDAAWLFVEYLSEPQTQLRFYRLTGNLPARLEAWEDPELAGDERARAFFEQLQHVVPMPRVPEWEQIATRIFEVGEGALRGRWSVDETLARLDGDVDRMLEKRRWILDRQAQEAAR
jgi:multiple sugar transport system substrate-binding protein